MAVLVHFAYKTKILMQCVVMLVAVVVGAAKMRNGMAKAKNRQLNQPLERKLNIEN